MNVLMLGRFGLFEVGGGDKIQITNTAKELERLGITVEIKDSLDFDVSSYDIIHIFQLDWTPESNIYAHIAKKAGKPVVFSPIHHSVKELKKFDDEYAFDFRRISKILFKDQFKRDVFKDFYRAIMDKRRIRPVILSIKKGLKDLHIETLKLSDTVLVQTVAEATDLKETFGVDFTWEVVPNGVGAPFLESSSYKNKFSFDDYIICVGRIEPRKNQLNIIKAVKKLRSKDGVNCELVFIGRKTGNKHLEYTYLFNKEMEENSWIHHVNSVPYNEMPSYYHFAKLGVSASWFETTGLTSLEALFSGANAVACGDRAREYLGDCASYCAPDSVDSIYSAIKSEYLSSPKVLTPEMRGEYTWKNAAAKTLAVYNKLIK
jgi:glycosyltransferase involved in cell wall biosynthesis